MSRQYDADLSAFLILSQANLELKYACSLDPDLAQVRSGDCCLGVGSALSKESLTLQQSNTL